MNYHYPKTAKERLKHMGQEGFGPFRERPKRITTEYLMECIKKQHEEEEKGAEDDE